MHEYFHSFYFQVLFGLTAFLGTAFCMFVCKFITKRSVYLFSIALSVVVNLTLGRYIYISINELFDLLLIFLRFPRNLWATLFTSELEILRVR